MLDLSILLLNLILKQTNITTNEPKNSHQTCSYTPPVILVLISGHFLLLLGQDMEQDQILVWPGAVASFLTQTNPVPSTL